MNGLCWKARWASKFLLIPMKSWEYLAVSNTPVHYLFHNTFVLPFLFLLLRKRGFALGRQTNHDEF